MCKDGGREMDREAAEEEDAVCGVSHEKNKGKEALTRKAPIEGSRRVQRRNSDGPDGILIVYNPGYPPR